MTIDTQATKTSGHPTGARHGRGTRRILVASTVAGVLALGVFGVSRAQTSAEPTGSAPVPTPAASLASGPVAIQGEVAEIFGNKFILQDASGRALIETGKAGEELGLVSKGETLTVQGRFEHGFIHARLITHADGRTVALASPPPPPGRGPVAWAKDKLGLGPNLDIPALTAAVTAAGYGDVRVTGRGPRHLEVSATKDGATHALHVDADGRIRDRPAP